MKNCLKAVRESKNATQEEVANQIGVTKAFISRVEKGSKDINLTLASEIADYLGVSLDDIAGRNKSGQS